MCIVLGIAYVMKNGAEKTGLMQMKFNFRIYNIRHHHHHHLSEYLMQMICAAGRYFSCYSVLNFPN